MGRNLAPTRKSMIKDNTLTTPTKLFNRNFLLLWQGQAVSQVGSQISTIAMLFWLKHATESPSLMGVTAMVAGLAAVLVGPIAGAFADRYSRRSIIIVCDLINGVAVISLAALMFFGESAQWLCLAAVFVVSTLVSVAHGFFTPAINASTGDLVPKEKVAGANSMLQASARLSSLVGLGIGGMLFRILGAPLVLLIDGITYLFSAISACFITIPQRFADKDDPVGAPAKNLKAEIMEGLSYVRANRGLTQLLSVAMGVNFLMAPILGLFPFYVEDHLKLDAGWYGYLLTIYGAGNLLGFVIAGTVKVTGKSRAPMIIGFMLFASVLYGLLGVASTPGAVAAIVIGIGASGGFMNVNIWTILQVTTPSEIRGRVFGLLATLSACLLPIGMGLAGAAASLAGKNISVIYFFCGGCMIAVTVVASLLVEFRKYLSFETAEEPEVVSIDQGVTGAAGAD
jgi:MFS transporter, DHA3 family, macrolide efflux protein